MILKLYFLCTIIAISYSIKRKKIHSRSSKSSNIKIQKFSKPFIWENSGYNASQELEYCRGIEVIDKEEFFNSNCCNDQKLCSLNMEKDFFYERELNKCQKVSDCITSLVKTSGKRDHKILVLIESAWKFYPEMKFIIISDDRDGQKIDPELQKYIDTNEKIFFEIIDPAIGLAHGRIIGLKKVKTPYVLLMEDDFKFTSKTKIEKLLDVIMSTSASLVAGNTAKCDFFGLIRFYKKNRINILEHFEKLVYRNLKNHKSCFLVDVTKNFFVARVSDLLEIGGWNKYLKSGGLEDLFIRLKLNEKTVIVCPEIYIQQIPEKIHTRLQRKYPVLRYKQILKKFWNIDKMRFIKKII